MIMYFSRRALFSVFVLLGITILVFFLIHLAPGDPIEAMYTNLPGMTQEQLDARKAAAGLDKPIIVQYFMYMKNMLGGNFGESIQYKRPVIELIGERIWNTFFLIFAALIIAMALAIPVGIISATKRYSFFDYLFTSFSFIGISVPSFFLGLLMIRLFSMRLGWLPAAGLMTPGANLTGAARLMDLLQHAAMPLSILVMLNMSSFTRFIRSSISEVIKMDYIRTARAKGLVERIVIYKHALRNGLIPIVTIMGSSLAYMFSGSLIIENIFSLPGLGRLIYDATMARDYYLMMAVNIFIAFLVILGEFLADAMLLLVDPRIKFK